MMKTHYAITLFAFFTIIFSASCLQMTNKAYANIGEEFISELRSSNISLSDAAKKISKETGVPFSNAASIASKLKSNLNINLPKAEQLLNKLKEGEITGEITKILSGLDLNLESISDIEDLFKGKIANELTNLAGLGQLPDEISDTISVITKLSVSPETLKTLGKEAVINAIISKLPSGVVNLLGNLSSLKNSLSTKLSSANVTPTSEPGKYEIPGNFDEHANAVTKTCNVGCDTCECIGTIEENHKNIRKHKTGEFIKHRNWMIDEFFNKHILPAMHLMTSQLSVISMQQTQMIGRFFDAKHQLESQRLFQQLMAEAHKDYQPSEALCEIGTNVRSLAASEAKSDLVHVAFSNRTMDRQLRSSDALSSNSDNSDIDNRITKFIGTYCNQADNSNGLTFLCMHGGGGNKARINKDINFTRTVESNLTLDIDFTQPSINDITPTEEDIFALNANLFSHTPLPSIGKNLLATGEGMPRQMAYEYMDLRAIAAKRNVAQNSFSALIAERASGDEEVARYLKKLVVELDIPPEEVEEILGVNPSYFAQMEVLTKDIYQNPVFYTELYDKPANVLRKGATVRAINLMQERDLYESQLRSEVVLAVMLETMLREEQNRLEAQFVGLKKGTK